MYKPKLQFEVPLRKLFLMVIFAITLLSVVACTEKTTTTTTTTITSQSTTSTTTTEVIVLNDNTQVVLYDGPEIMTSSDMVDISVEGHSVFAYETLVNYGRTFTYTTSTAKVPVAIWDFEGTIEVRITIPGDVEVTSAKVSPAAYGIEPVIENGDTIVFTLEYPTAYTVEYNDDYHNAIHLFTNTIEEETYDPQNLPEDVIYIGPGVYKADNIPVQSNQTLYIAGGAVVYGKIRTENMENITIKGRGIIDGSIYPRTLASEYTIPIELRHSSDITIDGITFLNPAGWCMAIYFSENITIQNVNIITARANGDGISVQSSKNVLVKNSFLRTWDDALVVKNYNLGTTENITFDNITIWTDLAQSMEVGYETYGETMTNIIFKNITVLHNFHKPVISIHNSDQADITFVTFQNITVEDAQMIGDNAVETSDDYLIEIFTRYNLNWSKSGNDRGSISNVLIDNLVVLDGKEDIVSLIHGYDATHKTQNITLSNIKIYGNPVNTAEDLNLTTNEYVSNVTISYDEAKAVGADVYYAYELSLPVDDVPEITTNPNITQEGYLVPLFARSEPVGSYMGSKVTGAFTAETTRGTEILIYDDGTGSYDLVENGSDDVIDGNPSTLWESVDYTETNKYYALSIAFNDIKSVGTIRLYGDMLSEIYQVQNIAIYGIKSTSETNVYTKILSTYAYEFSPAKGNVVDITIRSNQFKAIQFRFYYVDQPQYADHAFLSEVEFYPASLAFGLTPTGTEHEDVYEIKYAVDGNPDTYYESQSGTFPAEIIIDLLQSNDIKYISLYLPSKWENRTQEIEILTSTDGTNYTVASAKQAYVFATSASNVVEITFTNPIPARFVKVVIYSNSSGYGGQISEITIFS